ncbi:Lrp/AsnC family transcriptional regulator [Halostreptopolyspora alba]|uniref:Lrp/AsnC family transcriptional regulator n=1 Tax=Halostreptopolyspora alba TaxID=2487137 RepID=A0A3N0E6I3_9ACTN|nr:Lrp/AsnC family transcriptional regulator [Nocardiopsaceae bacterium YIM 96095]
MSATELDDTDAAIVRELQADGRIPYETLAGRIGLSRAAARLRVQRLERNRAIRVVGVLHPAIRGIGVLAQVTIGVDSATAPVVSTVADLSPVTTVCVTTGRHPLVAEVRERDLATLTDTVDRIRAAPGVAEVDTRVYTRVVKDPYLACGEPPRVDPDTTDLELLRLLQSDGRMSFAALAGHVDLSPGAVRSRVIRLLRGDAIRVTAIVNPTAVGMTGHGGFTVQVAGDHDGTAAEIASWDQTRFLTRCLGRDDLTGTVTAESVVALHQVFERLRALPGVRVTDTWIHLDQVSPRESEEARGEPR